MSTSAIDIVETIFFPLGAAVVAVGILLFVNRLLAKIQRTPPQPSPKRRGSKISSLRNGGTQGGQFDFCKRLHEYEYTTKDESLFPPLPTPYSPLPTFKIGLMMMKQNASGSLTPILTTQTIQINPSSGVSSNVKR